MREKLLDLMKKEGLRPSQLAEMLEINPAGISHILAGRNKPGFDLLQKILRRFPQINPDWLLLDQGAMYRETLQRADEPSGTPTRTDLFTSAPESPGSGMRSIPDNAPSRSPVNPQPDASAAPQAAVMAASRSGTRPVERIVIFYKDRTFECFTPQD